MINALKILSGGLKQLKLLACTEEYYQSGLISLSLNDVINIIDGAVNLEFFFIRADIDDFEEIYRHFAPIFVVVRYSHKVLLISQKEILETIQTDEDDHLVKHFGDIYNSLSLDFF